MKTKTLIPLVIGSIFGFVAIKLGVDAVKRAQGDTVKSKMIHVVMANTDIESTSEITAEMLAARETPATPLAPADAFSKIEDLVGRVTAKSIPRGSPILPSMLAPPGTNPGLEVRIEEGFRAVSVKIDEVSGVAFNLKPGDFVDVISVMTVLRNQKKETISNVILQRIQVGGVGQWLDDPGTKGSKARSVTLLVKDQDVPKLHLAQTKGKVTMAMRGRDDERITSFEPTPESFLTGGFGEPLQTVVGPTQPGGSTPGSAETEPQLTPAVKEWVVTVFNGPLKTKDTTAVHRVTYDSVGSMKVLRTENGRSAGRGDPDTAESIMQYRSAPSTDRRDRKRGGLDLLDGDDQDSVEQDTGASDE